MVDTIDTRASLNTQVLIVPRGEWKWEEAAPDSPARTPQLVEHVPCTWIEPLDWMAKEIVAIFSCPNCREVRILTKRVHEISSAGEVKPDLQCKGQLGKCTFHRKVFLDRWKNLPLYACAIECIGKFGRIPRIVYTHAKNPTEAAFMLGARVDGMVYDIVAIGPAIGFFVADGKDDTKLVAESHNAKEAS